MENKTITFELENTESAIRFFNALKENNRDVSSTDFNEAGLTQAEQEDIDLKGKYYQYISTIQEKKINNFKEKHITNARLQLAYTMAFLFAPKFVGERLMLANKQNGSRYYISDKKNKEQNLTEKQLITLFKFILDPDTRVQELEVLFNLRYNCNATKSQKATQSNHYGKYHGLRVDQMTKIKRLVYALQKYYTRKDNNRKIETEVKQELNKALLNVDKLSNTPVYKANKVNNC